jgi:hypothetical protein
MEQPPTSSTLEDSRTPPRRITTPDHKKFNLVIIEIGYCWIFGCHEKIQEKTTKYVPIVKAKWGKVEFVAVPVGHAGTILTETQRRLAQALPTARPEIERNRAR